MHCVGVCLVCCVLDVLCVCVLCITIPSPSPPNADSTPIIFIISGTEAMPLEYSAGLWKFDNEQQGLPLGEEGTVESVDADLLKSMIYWIDGRNKVSNICLCGCMYLCGWRYVKTHFLGIYG